MHVGLFAKNAAADEKTSPTRFATHVARQLRTIFVSARLGRLPVRSRRLLGLCWRRLGRPQRAHPGASWAASGASPERPGTACDGLWLSDRAPKRILERLGLDFGSSGEVHVASRDAFRFRFSRVLAWRVTLCLRACDSVRPTKCKIKKRGAFAFVLRLAARARLRDFHDFSHHLRAHGSLVAPR